MMLSDLQNDFQKQVSGDQSLGSERVSFHGHMEIYRNAYQVRLREALADNYPVLYRSLGDEAFAELTSAYCQAHPSRHRSIRWWGDSLVTFMRNHPEHTPHPALVDIAQMDWALRGAFDAANADCLTHTDLVSLAPDAWPEMRLSPVPSIRMVRLDWAVEGLWHALQDDPEATTEAPRPHEHVVLVWRQGLECHWRSLPIHEHRALELVQQGVCFGELCTNLQLDGDAYAADTSVRLLGNWVAEGLLARA
ncbi:DNA-binding domain-containing protein [Rhodoferax sp. GW822-FHT02A01]|uniref:DNA-binding domain-containing protein n=1 Tax=Rhodoferax sp. GW822-FHT02A01 TaxID=3141537 RepID=UPI00315D7E5C